MDLTYQIFSFDAKKIAVIKIIESPIKALGSKRFNPKNENSILSKSLPISIVTHFFLKFIKISKIIFQLAGEIWLAKIY